MSCISLCNLIRSLRTCTSTQRPFGPITVICNASYPVDLGGYPVAKTTWTGTIVVSYNRIYFPSQKFFIVRIRFVNDAKRKLVIDFIKTYI
jgi:hypothetical protein